MASDFFLPDAFTTCIYAYILMLHRFCSCALASLQKFVHRAYFSACALALNVKRINCYSSSYLLLLYKFLRINQLIKFLFNYLMSDFFLPWRLRKSIILARFPHQYSVYASLAEPSFVSVENFFSTA